MEPKPSANIVAQRIISSQRLMNKVAVITGSARGIGAVTAKLFAANGAHVVIADILDDQGTLLANEIGGRYIHCDVSKESNIESAIQLALSWKGRLDIMFNNAGIAGPDGSIADQEMEHVKYLISVNVLGSMYGTKHAARAMIENKTGGTILFSSSSAGIMGGLAAHAYTLSKGAIISLVRSVACELGVHGIRVNCISAHAVLSEMLLNRYRKFLDNMDIKAEDVEESLAKESSLLKGRCATMEDVAQAALFLSSEDAGFITAQNLVLDGGFTSACSTMTFIYQ